MFTSKIIPVVPILLSLFLTPSLDAQPKKTFIKTGKLFDGTSPKLRENVAILIQGDKIVDVGEKLTAPPDAILIDLSGQTVMPGLIDAHTHIILHQGNNDNQTLKEIPEFRAIYGTVNAKATIEAGITTIRDMGNEGSGFADIALRDAIQQGLIPGPRILASIQPVTSTGSYGLVGYNLYYQTPPLSYEADGPSEIRKQVRRLIREGADVIKIYLESYEKRELSPDSLTGAFNYSPEELKILVDEAHRGGLKVAAHAYTDAGTRMAIDAGVNSIEHGLYIGTETFRLMAQKGIYYVPTLLVYEFWRDSKIFGTISPENSIKLTNTVEKHTRTFQRALKTSVKIVFGTDTFELPGTNAQELELMVRYGMNPADALRSATSVSAELLGIGGDTGRIEKNKFADIIAFTGDPLQDIRVLQKVSFVMKGGKIYSSKP